MLMATIDVRTARPTATPTPAGPPLRVVAVVAVHQDDQDGEADDLAERPEHVDRWQVLLEVVVVSARRLPVVAGGDGPGGEVRGQQPDHVQRDHRDEPGDHPRGDQEGQRGDAHHLKGVHLLADPHRAELCGEPGADRRGQGEAGDERSDLTGVEVSGQERHEVGGAELVECRVPLKSHLGAGEEGEKGDDADGAADDRECSATEAHLGQQTQHLLLVAAQRTAGPGERAPVEGQLGAQLLKGAQRALDETIRQSHQLPPLRNDLEVDRRHHEVRRRRAT